MSVLAFETVGRPPTQHLDPVDRDAGRVLVLSESRTYDCALETLGAYKLTGNFPTELEIVLRDRRLLEQVTFQIKPKSQLSDCRQVEFRPKANVRQDSFDDIMCHIKDDLGVIEPPAPFWRRLLG
jgi:hypothetical protein